MLYADTLERVTPGGGQLVVRGSQIATLLLAATTFAMAGGLTVSTARAFDVNDPPPEVVVTWNRGIHSLPPSATRSGRSEDISFVHEDPKGWAGRLERDYLKPGVKVPAVIYLHGCKGTTFARGWAWVLNEFGFAFFAPDSFQRPGRVHGCFGGAFDERMWMREQEALYALHQIKKLPWVDQKRLILMGHSEGGTAVALFSGDDFIAHIPWATQGAGAYGARGSPNAPSGVAVLNIVGANDRDITSCTIWRDVGGSKSIVLKGQGHTIPAAIPEAVSAVAEFLAACCGYISANTTADLNVDETAKKLVEELRELATLDAQMKADDALGKGDKEGHKFWMRVHEIATKLTGG